MVRRELYDFGFFRGTTRNMKKMLVCFTGLNLWNCEEKGKISAKAFCGGQWMDERTDVYTDRKRKTEENRPVRSLAPLEPLPKWNLDRNPGLRYFSRRFFHAHHAALPDDCKVLTVVKTNHPNTRCSRLTVVANLASMGTTP